MIRQAINPDLPALGQLGAALWPHHTAAEMEAEFAEIMEKADAAFFVKLAAGRIVGFTQVGLRRDYVEGTDHSPVGYLEGIYVAEPFRGRGIARELLAACEHWAKEKGCREFASDCELDHSPRLNFHLAAGLAEAPRSICFVKPL